MFVIGLGASILSIFTEEIMELVLSPLPLNLAQAGFVCLWGPQVFLELENASLILLLPYRIMFFSCSKTIQRDHD